MILRRSPTPALGLLALAVIVLSGCSPEPQPTPTPPPAFASEEEAFAAAEEVYRAYTEATNATDLADPKTFEAVYERLVDEAESSARENFAEFYANGLQRSGTSSFDTFTPVSFRDEIVTVRLCLDVSGVDLVDAAGVSVVPADRPPRQPIEVEFVQADASADLLIASMISTENITC